jgi:hypothetical protein
MLTPEIDSVNEIDSDDDHVLCYEHNDESTFAGTHKTRIDQNIKSYLKTEIQLI